MLIHIYRFRQLNITSTPINHTIYSQATTPKRAAAPTPIAGVNTSAPLAAVALALAELAALVALPISLLAAADADDRADDRLDRMLDNAPVAVAVAALLDKLE